MATQSVAAYVLGLCTIDMMCDHKMFLPTPPSTSEIRTCVSYYANAASQPWYMEAIISLTIVAGTLLLLRRMAIARTIYDYLSVPFFGVAVALYLLKIEPARQELKNLVNSSAVTTQLQLLHEIAWNHVYIILSCISVWGLQQVATSESAKKYAKVKAT